MKYVEQIAYILTIVGAALYMPFLTIAPWVFAAGCLLLLGTHLAERYQGSNLRLKRLMRIRHLIGILYAGAAWFMFKPGNYWLPLLSVGMALEIYTLWVISKEKNE